MTNRWHLALNRETPRKIWKNVVRGVLVAAWLASMAACGQSSEETPQAALAEPIQFDASPETRAELGIERWGLTTSDRHGETLLRGYGAKGRVAQIRQLVASGDATHRTVEFSVDGVQGAAELRLEVEARPDDPGAGVGADEARVVVRVVTNTFSSAPAAVLRLLERADNDARSSPDGSTRTPSLVVRSKPMANDEDKLIKETCEQLVKTCGSLLKRVQEQTLVVMCQDLKAAQEATVACKKKAGFFEFGAESKCRALNQVEQKEADCAKATKEAIERVEKNYEPCQALKWASDLPSTQGACRPEAARPK